MSNVFSSGVGGTEKLFGVKVNNSQLGNPVPAAMGTVQVSQNILWIDGFTSQPDGGKKGGGGGGKGGGKGDGQYLYSADIIAALCAGPIIGIGDIWTGQSWLGSPNAAETYVIESPYTYTPVNASTALNDYGVTPASTYSATFTDASAPGSTAVSNTTSVPFNKVAFGNTLNSGQYSVNPSNGQYNFSPADAGTTVTLSYSFLLTTINNQENDVIPANLKIEVGGNNQFQADLGVVYGGRRIRLTG